MQPQNERHSLSQSELLNGFQKGRGKKQRETKNHDYIFSFLFELWTVACSIQNFETETNMNRKTQICK